MSNYREGSLAAPMRHPIYWENEEYYDETSLHTEMERVFDVCHTCRRCVNLCQSFPTLFDLVDESQTFEVDGVDKADYVKVVDQCYLCDLCFMTKCPYVPPHEWNIDFPHLMLRAKAVAFKQGKTKLSHKILTSPQKVGAFSSTPVLSGVINWTNKFEPFRKVLEKTLGVHVNAVIPKYHSNKLSKRFVNQQNDSQYKVAIFGTCYGEFNDPDTALDIIDVLRHNNVEVKLVQKTQCCGMPKMELGDLESVEAYAQKNIAPLLELVKQGYKLIAPIPSCVLMFKNELPMIMSKNKDIKAIGEAFYDPFEYLMFLNKEGVLKTDFKSINQHILYHVACHQRVQNIGLHTKKVLNLIPGLDLDVIQRCSGHDGTYGVRVETHTYAVKIGKPIAKKISEKTDLVLSDCVMAGNHITHISEHEVKAIHPMSLVKIAYGLDKETT